jgi:AcrR family transcriptional regulator
MAAPATPAKKPARRTQAERREATRTALLDAAIECLVSDGYAHTTTRRIAKRAGVTPGAMQHHFSSKAELLIELVGYLRAKWSSEMFAQGLPKTRSLRKRHEQLLDRAWRGYRGPYFQALLELGVGARTDPELMKRLVGSHDEVEHFNAIVAPILYPEHAAHPELLALIVTGQSTMRGLAIAGLSGEFDPDEAWPATRRHILAMNARVLGDPRLEP